MIFFQFSLEGVEVWSIPGVTGRQNSAREGAAPGQEEERWGAPGPQYLASQEGRTLTELGPGDLVQGKARPACEVTARRRPTQAMCCVVKPEPPATPETSESPELGVSNKEKQTTTIE